jgi:cytochrome c1
MKYLTVLSLVLSVLAGCKGSSPKNWDKEKIIKEGEKLFSINGCTVCHSLEGEVIYGPPLNNVYMKETEIIRDGKVLKVTADREYLKRAITNPRADRLLEYQHKEMPETLLSDEEVNILVEYLIILNEEQAEND